VIYVDLDRRPDQPATLAHAAIPQTREDLESPTSSILEKFKRVGGVRSGL
jgi:hypothetical protein